MPTIIRVGDIRQELLTFTVSKGTEITDALDLLSKILEEQSKKPNKVIMSHLVEYGLENDMYIDLFHFNNTVIYELRYPNSKLNGNDYLFTFAMRYDWI